MLVCCCCFTCRCVVVYVLRVAVGESCYASSVRLAVAPVALKGRTVGAPAFAHTVSLVAKPAADITAPSARVELIAFG